MYSDSNMGLAEKIFSPVDDKINRNVKDSVFVDLFGQSQYLLQLYQILHPEDKETTADDLTIITLENLFLKERYNNLGFMAGNRLMVLVEAQSSWSVNIVVRFLLYIADTYNRYIIKNDLDLYTSRKVELPIPELYVIYTGRRKDCPQYIRLGMDIFGQEDSAVDVKARVIQSSMPGDILNQYISFTRIFNEQVARHGMTRAAVRETLRICQEQEVLAAYLAEKEAATIMFTFVDREKQLERYVKEEREDAIFTSLSNLMTNLHMSSQQVLEALGIPADEQSKYLARLKHME